MKRCDRYISTHAKHHFGGAFCLHLQGYLTDGDSRFLRRAGAYLYIKASHPTRQQPCKSGGHSRDELKFDTPSSFFYVLLTVHPGMTEYMDNLMHNYVM